MIKINDKELLYHIVEIRRYLHMHPEKGLFEYNTSKYIASYLKNLGIKVIEGPCKTGVIGFIKGRVGSESIAVRADIDCLEINEQTGADYSSKNHGLMHACGHDGHMAAAMGLAKAISSGDLLKNNVVLIFQPAEEGPGGAKPIVESGVLDKFNIKAFLGMHIFPELEEGRIGCCSGPITARNGEIDIHIIGKPCHGALPHIGIDSVVISSELIQAIQTIITRRIDPRENAVITFGKIYGGEVRNMISGSVTLEGTMRAFSKQTYEIMKNNINRICKGLSLSTGSRIDAEIRDMYPEVYNDKNLFNVLMQAAGKDGVDEIKPLMIAEDFSFYRDVAPEIMFLLGSRNERLGFVHPLHSPQFNFNEEILLKAVKIFYNMIKILDL
ncbi:MAG TPA: amidohydrolase [Clostridiaceae bacterium]|nr:amidohydrolase [Clostridiaceae bacterium]